MRPTFVSAAIITIALSSLTPRPGEAQTADQIRAATQALQWRELGPTIMSGRVSDLAVVESDPRIYYVGTATGGIWKTESAGISYVPLFQDEATSSIGDVTVAPSNPNVVWVGTGEPQNRQSSPWGNGVYRSVDGGRTWSHLGLEATHHISRIQVHPRDPDVAYVAAVGHLWGSNPERGVFKTTDGGRTWTKVLYVDEHTGAIDLVMDPGDPQTLFAAMYQRQRRAWGFNGGGPGSGIHRTTDGGESWVELTDGLPEGDMGRIGLDVYRGDGRFVCALVEADPRTPGSGFGGRQAGETGFYCSTDRGESWEQRSTTNNRPMYYSQVRIDPNDPERIYLGGANFYMSDNGGRTFTDRAAVEVHLDHHALWINPADSDHLILAGDGGVSVSHDRSVSWYQHRNLPLAQFYEIGVDMRDPYHVCGGLQDNGSWCAPNDTWSTQGVRTRDWYNVGSGDGFFTVMHPTNPDLMFAESQGGNLTRVDLATGERARLRPIGRPGPDGELPDLRWNWNTPVVLSTHDENTVYIGANVLFKSTDLGDNWEQISSDLTHAIDRETLEIMGVLGSEPQMSLNDGQSSYGNLTVIAESPVDPLVLYTGSDDGRLQVTTDGGATWQDLTDRIDGLPANTYVTRIVASHAEAGTVYAAFDGHRSDDFAPYVFVSDDFGRNWTSIVAGLPQSSVSALAQHPRNERLLFVGNEVGVWMSLDGGAQWVELDNGLPTVPVDDIVIHPRENDLVLGTHGRGIWIMDDITPIERLDENVVSRPAFVFPVRRATSYNRYSPQGWTPGIYAAENPPAGARIRYYLSESAEDVALRVTDATGAAIRTLDPKTGAGLNEVVWDLRMTEEGTDGEELDPGPRVMPGTYLVELTTGNEIVQTEVTVRLDPRTALARRPMQQRHLAMLDSYRLSGPVGQLGRALDDIETRLDEVRSVIGAADDAPESVSEEVEALEELVDELRDELREAGAGAGEWRRIEGFTGPASGDSLWRIDRSWEELPTLVDRVNGVVTSRLPALLSSVYAAAVVPSAGAAITMPSRGR